MAQEQGKLNYKWVRTQDPRIKLRGEIYWARFTLEEIRVEESLKTKNFKVAKDLVEKIHARILTEGHRAESNLSIFKDAWAKFLKDKEVGVYTKNSRARTLKEYADFGERYFLDFFGHHRVDRITTETYREYVDYIQADRAKPVKMFNHEKYLNGFFSWALARNLISKKPKLYNPDRLLPGAEDAEGIGRALTDEEIDRCLEVLGGFENPFVTYFFCAIYMGMRSSEITQLKKDRINLKSGLIQLKKSDVKTKQSREVAIHPVVVQNIEKQMKATTSEFLFPNRDDIDRPMGRDGFKKQWDQFRIAAGVDCRFHDLRHTCATKLCIAGKNPISICRQLGMSMKMLEKIYLHLRPENLKAVMEDFVL